VTGYTRREPRLQGPADAPAYHEWLGDNSVVTSFHRTPGGYLVRFPQLADFEISQDAGAVACHPAPSVDQATCDHLFLNQVLPLVLSKRGKLVFHGSVVEIAGSAAAFLGPSGMGKSTLAAAFVNAGHRFLGDDGFVLEKAGDGSRVLPSHPSIRLWNDSESAILAGRWAKAPPVSCSGKNRLLEGTKGRFCDEALPLGAAYFLGKTTRSAIRFEPLDPSEALLQWVRNSFLLDPREPAVIATHFESLAGIANTLPCFRLDYPRRFAELHRVLDSVTGHFERQAA